MNLLTRLADPGAAFVPAPVAIEVTDAGPTVQVLAFQRRTGTIAVALWQAVASWDPVQHVPLTVPPVLVKVKIPGRRIRSWEEWQPDGTVEDLGGSGVDKQKQRVTDRLAFVEAV